MSLNFLLWITFPKSSQSLLTVCPETSKPNHEYFTRNQITKMGQVHRKTHWRHRESAGMQRPPSYRKLLFLLSAWVSPPPASVTQNWMICGGENGFQIKTSQILLTVFRPSRRIATGIAWFSQTITSNESLDSVTRYMFFLVPIMNMEWENVLESPFKFVTPKPSSQNSQAEFPATWHSSNRSRNTSSSARTVTTWGTWYRTHCFDLIANRVRIILHQSCATWRYFWEEMNTSFESLKWFTENFFSR